jgi:ubiquinone/menaquinone biosynthesis C-methylase UbiE
MVRQRLTETDEGIQGKFNVAIYDQMQRRFRDKGWMNTKEIISSGITNGMALEIGPGPGYLGLEWLKNTENTALKGVEISPDMISLAHRNAAEYKLTDRVEYVKSSGEKIPFENNFFDAVFTNGSLHEWSEPKQTILEIGRVLKPGGRVFISDLRRNMSPFIKWFMWLATKQREIRPGLLTSIAAAYTKSELEGLVQDTPLAGCAIAANPMGLRIYGAINK